VATIANEHISQLVKDKAFLVFVEKHEPVSSVLKTLQRHNITSVPVYDAQSKQFASLVSTMDLVAYVAFDTYFKRVKKEQIKFDVHFPDLTRPVIDVVTSRGRAEFHGPALTVTCDEKTTIRQALEIFTQGSRRVLVGSEPEKTKILSQVDVVKYLYGKFDMLPDSVKLPIEKLGLVAEGKIFHKLVAISHKNSAVEGFRKIYRQGVSAIAILDDNDKLVGTLSASDIRGLKLDQVGTVLEPVLDYLQKQHGQPRAAVTISPNEGLQVAMHKILNGRVHRAWVVDASFHPIGVVTVTDILCVIFEALKKEILHSS